jgi:hypothetical protein
MPLRMKEQRTVPLALNETVPLAVGGNPTSENVAISFE